MPETPIYHPIGVDPWMKVEAEKDEEILNRENDGLNTLYEDIDKKP